MIDTHCHLTDERLGGQLEEVLGRAEAAGVGRMITVGTNIADDLAAVELCRGRGNLRCTVGVHPNYVGEADAGELPWLRGIQMDPAVVALGEMGLDYHYDRSPRQKQAEFFRFQLALALEVGRPVVIHCREAVEDCLGIMGEFSSVRAVFHCFTGTLEEARKILDRGYLLGFTGAVTFKKADELREVARFAPGDRILVETDAPYLTPEPFRKQKVNEPAMVVHTAACVARVRGITVEEVDRVTTSNAEGFFGWAQG